MKLEKCTLLVWNSNGNFKEIKRITNFVESRPRGHAAHDDDVESQKETKKKHLSPLLLLLFFCLSAIKRLRLGEQVKQARRLSNIHREEKYIFARTKFPTQI